MAILFVFFLASSLPLSAGLSQAPLDVKVMNKMSIGNELQALLRKCLTWSPEPLI